MDADFTAKLDRAWQAMKEQASSTPSIGLILGSGLGEFAEKVNGTSVPFASLPGLPAADRGRAAGLFRLGKTLAVMAGRIHYYEGHTDRRRHPARFPAPSAGGADADRHQRRRRGEPRSTRPGTSC